MRILGNGLLASVALWLLAGAAIADDESVVFTPPGFAKPGEVKKASGEGTARVEISVRDRKTGKPTPCRLNVVGPDGNFYQPADGPLTPYSLTGEWPKTGKGNRVGKAPIRYFGRFFYTTGEATVAVPAGTARVEVWKGFEYRPAIAETRVAAGERRRVEIDLERAIDLPALGYDSGDSHLHFKRATDDDDRLLFNLMEAEDIRYASLLAYNEPAGPYHGVMEKMDTPQFRGLGTRSIRRQGAYQIASGQEYRGGTFGHLNLFWRDDLARNGHDGNTDDGPPYGLIGRETQKRGGFAFYAHGGYAQSIYADFVQRDVNGVELLQFGVYRGIGLDDWYRILNIGYRFPCIGASDYPACRKLGDCITYVFQKPGEGSFEGWLRGCAEGRSFVTTGPLLMLEVDGERPGATIRKSGAGPHRIVAKIRALSPVVPIAQIHLVVNGKVVAERPIEAGSGRTEVVELDIPIEVKESSWVAARAFSNAPTGAPDGEAHTNPVYVYLADKAPYDRAALDHLVAKLDEQMAIHRKRTLAQKAEVLDYFQKSRDILLRIREAGGLPADGVPAAWLAEGSSKAIDAAARAHTDEALKEFLKPLPARTPEEALKTIETVEGFHMELVAAEPLVASPVAGAFDENGDLYVAEMRDYPYQPRPGQKPLGTVRLLRDTNGDGRFDEGHIFADGLHWPAGVAPWKGGVFVAAPPDIWYFKDTDGDHRADLKRKVFTGFGTENEQGILNNLTFALDHRIYGSTSTNGGVVHAVDVPNAPIVNLRGKDFRIDPLAGTIEAITGTVQFGTTFDDWGNRFLCSESLPLVHAVLPLEYLARNPYASVPSATQNVAGHPVPIHRISPLERWRQIRSSRRIAHGERGAESAGASHHVIDAAAGVMVYRGGAYAADYAGNVFVSDAQNNLVHRMVLTPDGPTFKAHSGEKDTEFVRSYDNWFRPVNLLNAPDGTLYVLDMSREIIEAIHIPLDVVKHLDLRRGRDQGRVYRIAPNRFHSPAPLKLGNATTSELVAALESSSAWARDTAHRLLYERNDFGAVAPLQRLVGESKHPQARILALWSLQKLGGLTDEVLKQGMDDQSPHVREHAIRLAERRLDGSAMLTERVIALADDPELRVRFQAAFSLGESHDPRAVAALARIARRDVRNHWMATAVLSSAGETAGTLLGELLADRAFTSSAPGAEFLDQLAGIVGVRNQPDDVGRVLDRLAASASSTDGRALASRLLLALARGQKRAGFSLHVPVNASPAAGALVGDFLKSARAIVSFSNLPPGTRVIAIELLGYAPLVEARDVLGALLDPGQPPEVQVAAVKALAGYSDATIADLFIARLSQLTPAARDIAVESLLARDAWTLSLLRAVKAGRAALPPIDATRKPLLLQHRKTEIATLAKALLGVQSAARERIVADYLPSLKLTGNAKRGSELFGRHCIACHRIENRGHAVGPDLTASQYRDPADLLTHILDPNRNVPPNYVQYVVADRSGRVYTGIIVADTATSLTLRRGEGVDDSILRSQLEELTSMGKSLMPEGFEKDIAPQDMADLIAYLTASHRGQSDASSGLDIGTLPGAVEPDE